MAGETEFTVHIDAALDGDLQDRCEALLDALEPYAAAGSVNPVAGTVGATVTVAATGADDAERQARAVFTRACEQIGAVARAVTVELDA